MTADYIPVLIAAGAFLTGLLVCRALVRRHHASMNRLRGEHSICRADRLELGGVRQWVTIRGRDRRKPVLLFLHGGPGTTFSGVAYSHQAPWEEFFTVVNWDQRGSGRSQNRGDRNTGFENLVNDSIELIDYLRKELNQDKVFLFGHSWGGFLGLTVARRRPDLLHAFIGLAPLLGIRQGYRESRKALIEAAEAAGDSRIVERLRDTRTDLPDAEDATFLKALGDVIRFLPKYGMSWHNQAGMGGLMARVLTIGLLSPALKLREAHHPLGGKRSYVLGIFRDIADMYVPETLGTQFETPMILLSGEHDQQSPTALVRDFAEQLSAPVKAFRTLAGSAHVAVWEAPGQILEVLINDALPLANASGDK